MQDEIRLRLSSGRELRLYRDDCGDCVRVTYDVGGETWAAALKESELALGVGRVAHKI